MEIFKIKIEKKEFLRNLQGVMLNTSYNEVCKIKDDFIIFNSKNIKKSFIKRYNSLKREAIIFEVEKGLNSNFYKLSYYANNKVYEVYREFYKGVELRINADKGTIEEIEKEFNLNIMECKYFYSVLIYDNYLLSDILNFLEDRNINLNNDVSIRRLSFDEVLYNLFGKKRNRFEFYNSEDIIPPSYYEIKENEEIEYIDNDWELEELEEVEPELEELEEL